MDASHFHFDIYAVLGSLSSSVLLGVMGFNEYMDNQGKFITQAEADTRVAQIQYTRKVLIRALGL